VSRTWVEIEPEQAWWNCYDYRIAPKKELTLVDRLRELKNHVGLASICAQAADRIEELEATLCKTIRDYTTDELLDELKRRISV